MRFIELTDSELAGVKKEIYAEGFKKFEEEYGKNVNQLSSFFDVENDGKDKSKTMRSIYRNIKSRMIGYIDFDNLEMPIPAKYDEKMIQVMNPLEEIAKDVVSRLNFLFEVKPSKNYKSEVTSKLNLKLSPVTDSGLDELLWSESDKSTPEV